MSLPDRTLRETTGSTRVARLQLDLATRVGDSAWNVLHALGAHRWREGWVEVEGRRYSPPVIQP